MLKKENRAWTADFRVSHDLLKNQEISFVFSDIGHLKAKGKMIEMPSVEFMCLGYRILLNNELDALSVTNTKLSQPIHE